MSPAATTKPRKPQVPPAQAAAMHAALADTLAIIDRQIRIAAKAQHLRTLEDTLYRIAGDNAALELVPLRLAVFHDHWPEPAPQNPDFRRDFGVLLGDLARNLELLRTPEQLHVPQPETRKQRRRRT